MKKTKEEGQGPWKAISLTLLTIAVRWISGNNSKAEGTACAKVLRQEQAWTVVGGKRTMRLEQGLSKGKDTA